LIQVKARRDGGRSVATINPGEHSMPTDIAFIVVAILTVFVIFGAVVAYVDVYSRRGRQHPAE
jgi:hypothetical protein